MVNDTGSTQVFPPLPHLVVDGLTARYVSQEEVDTALHLLSTQKPEIIAQLVALEKGQGSGDAGEFLDMVGSALRVDIAPQMGGFSDSMASDQMVWELRRRVHYAFHPLEPQKGVVLVSDAASSMRKASPS